MPIDACYKIGGIGTVVCGRIESGRVPSGKPGVMFGPTPNCVKETKFAMTPWLEIKGSNDDEKDPSKVPAGTIIGLNVRNLRLVREMKKPGYVLSDPENDPCRNTVRFTAQIIVMNHQKIKNGYMPMSIAIQPKLLVDSKTSSLRSIKAQGRSSRRILSF